ncbi:MAG: MaoC/PaaZ C-terminal domain-containing protein, partial [Pirellulaceae bacterium]
ARTITEADIVNFAGITGDFDPLHVDHESAAASSYGRPIAHGLLGLSFVAGLSSYYPSVQTAAFIAIRQWEFMLPLFVGDTVHVVNEVIELDASSRRHGRVTWNRKLVNQKGEIVQKGTLETLVATKTEGTRRRDESVARESQPSPHTSLRAFSREGQ